MLNIVTSASYAFFKSRQVDLVNINLLYFNIVINIINLVYYTETES